MIDLLKEVYKKNITLDQAWEIFNEITHKSHKGIIENTPFAETMLDQYERSAFAHGEDFDVIAKWRYEGWPTTCSKCKKKLDYKKFGWFAEKGTLTHIKCL